MTDIRFGRLSEIPLRDAWRNEGSDFTPWLARNIGQLAELVGIPSVVQGPYRHQGGTGVSRPTRLRHPVALLT